MSVHSSEIFDEVVLLGFVGPRTFEARQVRAGEPPLFITISREEMDEMCSYWQELHGESKTPKSYRTNIVKEGDVFLLPLPDDLMKEGGYVNGDEFEVSFLGGSIILEKRRKI